MSTHWQPRSSDVDLSTGALSSIESAVDDALVSAMTPGAGPLWLTAYPEVTTTIIPRTGSTTYTMVSPVSNYRIGIVGFILTSDASVTWSLKTQSDSPLVSDLPLAANQMIALPVCERRQYVGSLEEGINLHVSDANANIIATVSYILLSGF